MDDGQLEVALAAMFAPPLDDGDVQALAGLFDRRAVTAELAERQADTAVPSDVDGDLMVIEFESASQVITAAVSLRVGRVAVLLSPTRVASMSLSDVDGPWWSGSTDDAGIATIGSVPCGPLQLVVDGDDDGRSVRTAWTRWIADGNAVGARDALPVNDELDGNIRTDASLRAVLLAHRPRTTTGSNGLVIVGRFAPSNRPVDRNLPAAALSQERPLPFHQWTSDDEELVVRLEESVDGALLLTVEATPRVPSTVLVSVAWTISSEAEDAAQLDVLSTPLPFETVGPRRATYCVGDALSVRAFGIDSVTVGGVQLTPAIMSSSLAHQPFGNAIRAWQELLTDDADPSLRRAFADATGVRSNHPDDEEA